VKKLRRGCTVPPNKNPTQDLKSTILVKVKPKGEREALEHEILTHHNSRSPAQSFSTLKNIRTGRSQASAILTCDISHVKKMYFCSG